ncbi:hypothetical protein [Streptomyces sp. NRRL F-5123]|uniref:hypothetical protein n=1 Tax=Streptomyces sp. NRRL F-5123 TaxID=1463856 RepID=UPI000693BF56|nr:hypothetical protein [Streptomyces sp. NRRL F-5123]
MSGAFRRGGRALAVPAVLGVLAGLTGLTGCGIPTTGVVEAGEAGSGIHPATTLYFVRTDDGSLATVRRRENVPMGAEGALSMLFKGLDPMEGRLLGLTTLLYPAPGSVRLDRTEDTLTVDLGPDAGHIPPAAVDQIVCTATTAETLLSPGATPFTVEVTAAGRPQHGALPGPAACPTVASATPVATYPKAQNP